MIRNDESKGRLRIAHGLAALGCAAGIPVAFAQTSSPPGDRGSEVIDPVVVTATRSAERAFDLPVAIDSVDAATIQQGQLQVNLSESLARVPGLVVQSRWNYAQDLMLSIRGFGARANFGVRGIRLYQDDIPVTMPDGQGQTGSFSLVSAKRIEVLRGPFSTLYGNASGGVISVFTEDGPTPPALSLQAIGGSYRTSNIVAKLGGQEGTVNYDVAANRFETDGYRDHSEASRSLVNARLAFAAGPLTQVTLIGNWLCQPDARDPLGLTRAQWEADPRQADPAATLFDTRKTVNQMQGGATVEQKLPHDAVLRATGYGGTRSVRQYLALPGTAPTSSGGVTDLDRSFGGIDARVSFPFGGPAVALQVTLGGDYETQQEARKGFVNANGALGAPRRDEDNKVTNGDVYAQLEWRPIAAASVLAGIRYSSVRFRSEDHYIVPGNPDDSGSVSYQHTSPVVGAVWHVRDGLNLYANYGEGFETPTFTELAYRPVGSGLNLGLEPSVSKSAEVGMKARIGGTQRLNLAVFATDTENDIVINTATGGRTTYKNAAKTKRRGAEVAWEAALGGGLIAYASYTYLDATYASEVTTGAPPVTVPSGSKLPGVPASAGYAELAWSRPQWSGFNAALEVAGAGKVYVNDRNSDAAPGYAIANLRVGFAQQQGRWQLREFVRVNNVGNVNYAGSVIVGDTNGRFFEPSAERNFLVGLAVSVSL
jgi:iron complex outermembrane receptor protein